MADDQNNREEMDVEINLDIEQAQKAIENMRRQIELLGDMADRGDNNDGFLSEAQVELYKEISKEMEQEYEAHYQRLSDIEQEYSQKISDATKEVERRQELLDNAQGGNKHGDVASEQIQEFHQKKLTEAIENLDSLEDVSVVLGKLEETIDKMDTARADGSLQQDRISEMRPHDSSGSRQVTQGAQEAIGASSLITTVTGLMYYMKHGAETLRYSELESAHQIQRSGDTTLSDKELSSELKEVGLENQYGMTDTAELMGASSRGGTSNQQDLLSDVEASQEFSRAYATDPHTLTESGNMLQRMGAMEEGDMKHFADLIAGAIAHSDMGGREEEFTRSNNILNQSVSRGLAELTDKQSANIIGMQAELGEAVPSLRGERGAEMLQNVDEAIKTGDQQFDLIMGRGTDFVGIEGMYELEKLKEEGIANPETVQRFMQGMEDRLGLSPELQGFAMKEHLGLTLNQQEALRDAGVLDSWKQGTDLDDAQIQQLKDEGQDDLVEQITGADPEKLAEDGGDLTAEQIEQWKESQAETVQQNEAEAERRQSEVGTPWERITTGAMDLINEYVPKPVQNLVVGAGAVGAGMMIPKAFQAGKKLLTPNIGRPDGSGVSRVPERLADAGKTAGKAVGRGAGKAGRFLGRNLPGVGIAAGAFDIARSFISGEDEDVAGSVGGVAGATAGAKGGAMLGSFGGPIGAIAGGIIGGGAGYVAGSGLFKSAFNWIRGEDGEELTEEEQIMAEQEALEQSLNAETSSYSPEQAEKHGVDENLSQTEEQQNKINDLSRVIQENYDITPEEADEHARTLYEHGAGEEVDNSLVPDIFKSGDDPIVDAFQRKEVEGLSLSEQEDMGLLDKTSATDEGTTSGFSLGDSLSKIRSSSEDSPEIMERFSERLSDRMEKNVGIRSILGQGIETDPIEADEGDLERSKGIRTILGMESGSSLQDAELEDIGSIGRRSVLSELPDVQDAMEGRLGAGEDDEDIGTSRERSDIEELTVNTLNIQDKSFAEFMEMIAGDRDETVEYEKTASVLTRFNARRNDSENPYSGDGKEHTLRILVEGKIDGMNNENQGKLTRTMETYFTNTMGGMFAPTTTVQNALDLSLDQLRD